MSEAAALLTEAATATSTTLEHLWLASGVVFLGAMVEGILGFGCSLIWMAGFPMFTTIQGPLLTPMFFIISRVPTATEDTVEEREREMMMDHGLS